MASGSKPHTAIVQPSLQIGSITGSAGSSGRKQTGRWWQRLADDKEAIAKVFATSSDFAVLDYSMPLINGVGATRQIRARLPTTEVLIYTVHDDLELIHECLKAGARSYLLKSNMESHLLSAIESLAMHEPFFTGNVFETLLDSYLASRPTLGMAQATEHNLPL